jgi:ribulose-phosphate 3-epimerase
MIAPSILSADFSELGLEIDRVEKAGASWLHVDVMDGRFVPNLTIGMPVVKSLKPKSKIPLDVHLMIERPERYIEEFIRSGADYLTIHVESTDDVEGCLSKIRSLNCKSGITLRPKTSLSKIEKYLSMVDLVLVMSVEPGFGGQSFMTEQLEKVKKLVELRKTNATKYLIEIDGGVNQETAKLCWAAGCDVLVAGSAIFNGEKTAANYSKNIESLI